MSISRLFTVIGDSNIRDNMTSLNMASREVMKHAQVLNCPQLSGLGSVFSEIRVDSNVCVFAGVTQLLMSTPECSTIYATIDPVLASLKEEITRSLLSGSFG